MFTAPLTAEMLFKASKGMDLGYSNYVSSLSALGHFLSIFFFSSTCVHVSYIKNR